MATVNTTTTLDGLFKRIYADRLINLIPENAKLVKDIKFSQNDRLGDTFEQPVVLTNEHGVTYAAAGAGAFALNASIAMTTRNARVPSVQKVTRTQMDYESASKASSGGERAFRKATELVVKNMMDSISHRLECSILYGNTGIGTPSSSANASATSTVITLSAASWAVGIWAGAENARLNVYDDAGNPVGGATYDATDSIFTISAIDVANKAITVTGSATGISNLDTAIADTAGDLDLYWYGSYGTSDAYGIDYQITTSGSIFGINNSTYHLWKGNSYAIDGAISLAGVLKSTTSAVGKGLKGKVNLYMAPQIFAVLNAEISAYQRFDSSYSTKEADWGTQSLKLYAQHGMLEVIPHNMVKAGEAFAIPLDVCKRIGSTDVTFNNPGVGDRFFRELTDNAGFELRNYTDQAFFIDRPSVCTKLTGITY